MAIDKAVDSAKLNACLDAEADAIRAKTGGSADIPFDYANSRGFADAIAAIPSGGSGNLRVTIASTLTKLEQFIALLPSGHESEGFTATALDKPSSGYYVASLSGPVTAGNAYLAIMRSSDGQTPATATTGQAWGGYPFQAGTTYEVIFYEL